MNTIKFTMTIRLTEPLLGTASGNHELHEEFIAAKADTSGKVAEELAALPAAEQIEKSSTVFPRDERGLFLWDYQMKGFLKEAVGVLCEMGAAGALTKWTYKRAVDSCVFVYPRRLYLVDPVGRTWTHAPQTNQRPLRAETMQGDRVALARSEELPAGTSFACEIELLLSGNARSKTASLTEGVIEAALEYGKRKGIGQWRNAGYGRFAVENLTKA